jgi:16S rRNA (guanine966-N2)-methyltransferase
MRVVSGVARGRRLVAPPGERTRPTSDRVREAIFNALASRAVLDGARVVDLFAGSGALGIEALSRGASHATFVDSDAAARAAIRRNLEACGFLDRSQIVATSVERFLQTVAPATNAGGGAAPFDIALCDPPYGFDGWAELLAARPADFVVAEAAEPVTVPPGWQLTRQQRYGAAWVGFLVRE